MSEYKGYTRTDTTSHGSDILSKTGSSSDLQNTNSLAFDTYGNLLPTNIPKVVETQEVSTQEGSDQIYESLERVINKKKPDSAQQACGRNKAFRREESLEKTIIKQEYESISKSEFHSDRLGSESKHLEELMKVNPKNSCNQKQYIANGLTTEPVKELCNGFTNGFLEHKDFEISDSAYENNQIITKVKPIGYKRVHKKAPNKTSHSPKIEETEIKLFPIFSKRLAANKFEQTNKQNKEANVIPTSIQSSAYRREEPISRSDVYLREINGVLQPSPDNKSVSEKKVDEIAQTHMQYEANDPHTGIERQGQNRKMETQLREPSEAIVNQSAKPSCSLLLDNQEMQEKIPIRYFPGDLVWVYVKGNPMWPSIITCPNLDCSSTKLATHVKNQFLPRRIYHTLFLNDGGRTMWVNTAAIVPFEGQNNLIHYLKELKKTTFKNPSPMVKTLLQKTGTPKYNRWQQAIKEAESKLLLEKHERTSEYTIVPKLKSVEVLNGSEDETTVLKRKRNPEDTSSTIIFSDSDGEGFQGFQITSADAEKHRKRQKLQEVLLEGLARFINNNLTEYLQQNEDCSEERAKKDLASAWKAISSTQKTSYKRKSKHILFDIDSSSNPSSNVSKIIRNRHISYSSYKVSRNEKVCQKCYQPGENDGQGLVKCKGYVLLLNITPR